MNISDIEVVCAVSRFKNYSEAAAYLFTTESSISKKIRKVEEELGAALFERAKKNSSISLTPQGEQLIEHFNIIQNNYRSINNKIALMKKAAVESIIVGYVRHIGGFFEQNAISGFVLDNPDVRVSYLTSDVLELVRLLVYNEITAAFVGVMDGFDESRSSLAMLAYGDFIVDKYFSYNQLTVGVSEDHPLANYDVITREQYPDLAKETFLMPVTQIGPDYEYYRMNIQNLLGYHGDLNIRYVDQSVPSIALAMVKANKGVLLQGCVVPERIGNVRFIPLQDSGSRITMYFVSRRGKANSAVSLLRDHILEYSKELNKLYDDLSV